MVLTSYYVRPLLLLEAKQKNDFHVVFLAGDYYLFLTEVGDTFPDYKMFIRTIPHRGI